MFGGESRRSAPPKDSRGRGGTNRTLVPPSGSGPDPPGSRDPPLTFQIKIARGDQTLFESTPTEIPSQALASLLKFAPGSMSPAGAASPTLDFGPKTQDHPTLDSGPRTLDSGSSSPVTRHPPRYSLRRGFGTWHLIFDGQEATLKHERGIFYVAYLLTNPPEHPIHALDLAAKIPEIYRRQLGLPEISDPATGKSAALQSDARIQERSLALDDAQAIRAILRKEKELEAILDDESASEPEKAEALRELEAITEFQRQHGRRSQDSAQKTVRAVRRAIMRFHQRLLETPDQRGNPHPVLRPFAAHVEKHLLIPSARYCGPTGTRARGPLAGCFTYDPPPGITWAD
jgi:hypothetical protein